MVNEEIRKLALDVHPNKSTFFIFPMLQISMHKVQGFVNCYILDINNPEYEEHIFIVLSAPRTTSYSIQLIKSNEYFIEAYIAGDYLVFINRVPTEFENDYKKFLIGKYSQFSEGYKTIVGQHTRYAKDSNGKTVTSKAYRALRPTKADREYLEDRLGVSLAENAEILSSPDLNEETFQLLKTQPK